MTYLTNGASVGLLASNLAMLVFPDSSLWFSMLGLVMAVFMLAGALETRIEIV